MDYNKETLKVDYNKGTSRCRGKRGPRCRNSWQPENSLEIKLSLNRKHQGQGLYNADHQFRQTWHNGLKRSGNPDSP